jgi:hypothetical protein
MTTTPKQVATEKTAGSTWRYEEGVLTVRHLGKNVSLGRYATRGHAAKAAAVYFAARGGRQ